MYLITKSLSSKIHKEKWTELKGEIDNPTVIVWLPDPISIMDRTKQIINTEKEDLNNIIKRKYLTDRNP